MKLNKDVSSWAKVKPLAVIDGSMAQAENVLAMALHDIHVLGASRDAVAKVVLAWRTGTLSAQEAIIEIAALLD